MPKLNSLKAREVVRALLRADFFVHHQKGSHVHLRHRVKPYLRVTIPYHTKFDLPLSVVRSILNQAEVSADDFLELL